MSLISALANVHSTGQFGDHEGKNENYKKIVNSSAFCSADNNIISYNYKIKNNEKIAIIPPIGGG